MCGWIDDAIMESEMHNETMAEFLGQTKDGLWEVKVYPFGKEAYVEGFIHLRDAELFLYQFRELN